MIDNRADINLNRGLVFFTRYYQNLITQTNQVDLDETNQDLINFYLAYWQISKGIILTQLGTKNLRNSLNVTEVWKKSLADIFKQSLIDVLNKPETSLANLFEEISASVVYDLLGRNAYYKIVEESDNPNDILVFNKVKILLKQLFSKSIYSLLTSAHIKDGLYSNTAPITEKIRRKLEELKIRTPIIEKIRRKLEEFKLRTYHQEFIDRQESHGIIDKSKIKLELQESDELELQEFAELCFSCLSVTSEKKQFLEIFGNSKESFLPQNSFSNSDLIDLDKIFDFFTNIDKLDPVNEQEFGSQIELNDLEKSIFVKLLILHFIKKAKQAGNTKIDLETITRIVEENIDSHNAKNLVWQNYLLCLKQKTTINKEVTRKEENQAELSLSGDDYDLLIPENRENFALLEIYLPGGKNNIGRLKIPWVEGETSTSDYLRWLKASGLKDFIDKQVLNNLKLEGNPEIDKVVFNLICPDGSLEVTSTDNTKIGVTTKFPKISYKTNLYSRPIEIEVNINLIDHHPRVGDKMSMDSSCLQVRKECTQIPISTNQNELEVVVTVLERIEAADTDWGTSPALTHYYYSDPEWFKQREKEINIVTSLINIIDIYNGAPVIDNPLQIDKYIRKVLLLQALIIPTTAYLTVNRGQVAGLLSKDVIEADKKIFKLFIDFINKEFPNIKTFQDLIIAFYGDSEQTLNKNLSSYENYLLDSDITQERVHDIKKKFEISFIESMQIQEAEIQIFEIQTDPVVKIAIYKSNERRDTRVKLREEDVAMYLLRKNDINETALEKQNYTCGMLLPKDNGKNSEYINNIRLVKKLFTEFLDICYSATKGLPYLKKHVEGGDDSGTRDAGSGLSRFPDNEPLTEIFVERLNQLLKSGLSLNNITMKSICATMFIDKNGVSNNANMNKINQILARNKLNALKVS